MNLEMRAACAWKVFLFSTMGIPARMGSATTPAAGVEEGEGLAMTFGVGEYFGMEDLLEEKEERSEEVGWVSKGVASVVGEVSSFFTLFTAEAGKSKGAEENSGIVSGVAFSIVTVEKRELEVGASGLPALSGFKDKSSVVST